MSSALDFAVGCVELALALLVLLHLRRFWQALPWLAALTIFFAFRGVDRIWAGVVGGESRAVTLLLDGFILVVLLLLLAGIGRTLRGLQRVEDVARATADEYARAHRDYRSLVRHRIANPLTVIIGSARTLRELPDLNRSTKERLLDTIEESADRLAALSIEPFPEASEEATLHPLPNPDVVRSWRRTEPRRADASRSAEGRRTS